MKAAVALLLLAATGEASDTFTPPLIGYVAGEGGKDVRAIVGTPGAARVLPPLALPPGIQSVVLAPGRPFGIAAMEGIESLVVLYALDTEPAAAIIVGAMKSFDRAAFSVSGKAVAVYGKECGCVQAVTGLPDAPQVRTVDVSGKEVTALAVNDDASIVVRAAPGELALFKPDSVQTWSITSGSIALSADASMLAVVDTERKAVSVVRDPAGAAEWTVAVAEGEPVAVGFTGSAALVVGDATAGLRIIDNSSGQTAVAECACRPSAVERTAVGNAYRLTGVDAGAVWLLQTGENEARTTFVPVPRQEPQP